MKHIQKKISLEQFKSRMPSIIPAFHDNKYVSLKINDEIVGFDNVIIIGKDIESKIVSLDEAKKIANDLDLDLVEVNLTNNPPILEICDYESLINETKIYYEFDGKSNFDDKNQRIPYTNYGLIPYGIKWDRGKYSFYVDNDGIEHYISYNTLSSWFHFIEFYLNLLKKNGCLKNNYTSAKEYSHYEVNPNYNELDYINFDNKIKDICGEPINKTLYEQAKETYEFMISNYFPRFNIEERLQIYWNKKYLSINEVNYWVNWFENVKKNIGDNINNVNDCPKTDNCCDCEKYFNLGGNEMLEKLKLFIENIEKQLVDNYCKPFFSIKISLGLCIDDLGEFSTLYEEWEGGVDYSNNKSSSGAVVQYNNQDWELLYKEKGYIYSDEFKEIYFNNNDFIRLIEKKALDDDGNPIFNFNGGVNSTDKYAYDFYGNKINFSGEITNEICKKIYQKFPIINNNYGFFDIKGKIYEVNEYIDYNTNFYIVNRDSENNPFLTINYINYYGIYDSENNDFIFKINNDKISFNETIHKGIKINDKILIEENNKIKYGKYFYNKIPKYTTINGENILLNNKLKTICQILTKNNDSYEFILTESDNVLGKYLEPSSNQLLNPSTGYTTDDNYVYLVTSFNVYNSNEITGYTESKLSSFITATDIVYDNLGNKLPGIYINSQQLKDGDWLGLIYKPKTTIHLTKEEETDDSVKCWGDYLSDIILYYVDANNNILTSEKKLGVDGNLLEIVESLNSENELNGREGKLICNFVYYMGCVINIKKRTNEIEIIDDGVKYIDTTELVEKTCKYFFNDYTCYILKYYDIIHDEINYRNDTYNFNSYVKKSQFSVKITSFKKENEFTCNGWVDFPVIREEYKLGSSSLSNINVDVNIDRGTARAFDQHIKLLEVNSLESLEQYGNGYFNIITN